MNRENEAENGLEACATFLRRIEAEIGSKRVAIDRLQWRMANNLIACQVMNTMRDTLVDGHMQGQEAWPMAPRSKSVCALGIGINAR